MKEKWYDLVTGDENRVEMPFQATEEDFFGTDSCQLEIGSPIENWNSNATLRSDSAEHDGDPDDILGEHLGVPTFSYRLRQALERAGIGMHDIQYLPVRVLKSTGEEIKGFAIANVITRLPALDYGKSFVLDQDETRIDPLTGKPKVRGIGKIALKGAPLVGHDVIRLIEFFPAVVVSHRFAEVFRKGKFTGATLRPLLVS